MRTRLVILAVCCAALAGCGSAKPAPMAAVPDMVAACQTLAQGYQSGQLPQGPAVLAFLEQQVDFPAAPPPLPVSATRTEAALYPTETSDWTALNQAIAAIVTRIKGPQRPEIATGIPVNGLSNVDETRLRSVCAPTGVKLPGQAA